MGRMETIMCKCIKAIPLNTNQKKRLFNLTSKLDKTLFFVISPSTCKRR